MNHMVYLYFFVPESSTIKLEVDVTSHFVHTQEVSKPFPPFSLNFIYNLSVSHISAAYKKYFIFISIKDILLKAVEAITILS